MLEGLIEKAENEGKSEQVSYTKFEYWCKNSISNLDGAIAEEKDKIDALESKIEAKTKEEATLTKEIGDIEEQIGELNAAGAKAEADRNEEAALYTNTSADFESTISSIDQCLTSLDGSKKTTESTGLLQAQGKIQKVLTLIQSSISDTQLTTLQGFVTQSAAAGAPAPASGDSAAHVDTYKFKSGSVVELLKELKAKFEADLLQATKEETNRANAYALSKKARDAAIAAAEKSKEEKENELGDVQSDLATAKSDLGSEKSDLAADEVTLKDTHKSCELKATEWRERSAMREQEIEAMKAAIKILAEVGGVRTEAPSNPVPPTSPVQTGSGAAFFFQIVDPKTKVVNFLRQQARLDHSKVLEHLAQQLAMHEGPFDEVKQMIQKMIFRLMAEQKDEDEHKNWCDMELEKTNTSKVDKEDKITELTLKIDDAEATVQTLTEDITEAEQMVTSIVSHVKEATEIREVGKKENTLAVKDAQAAQSAISNAIAVLEEFYKESGMVPKEAWEFLQSHRQPVELPENPATWDSGYTGVTDPASQPSGIITVLKECSGDFAKMEADTNAQETTDQKAHDDDMQACDIEKARRSTEIDMKNQEKKRLVDKIASLTSSRKHVSGELESVMQYLKDLQPACGEGDSDYETRKSARTMEVQALNQAKAILENAFKEGTAPAPAAASSFLQRHRVA